MSVGPVDELASVPIPDSASRQNSVRAIDHRIRRLTEKPKSNVPVIILDALMVVAAAVAVSIATESARVPKYGFIEAVLTSINGGYWVALFAYALSVTAWGKRLGLYRNVPLSSMIDEGVLVGKAVLFGCLVLISTLYVVGNVDVPMAVIVLNAAASALCLLTTRQLRSSELARSIAAGRGVRNTLILGTGAIAQKLAKHLETRQYLGYVIKGFLDDHRNGDSRVIGTYAEMPAILRSYFIDEVFVTPPAERRLVKNLALQAADFKVNVKVVPDLLDEIGIHVPIEYAGDFPVIALHSERAPRLQLLLKRALDLVAAAIGVLVASPLFLLICLLIKIDSSGPVFYSAERVGQKGRIFRCWKFRTMVSNAEALLDGLLHLNEREQILFKLSNDPRLTRVGKFLRRYSLDELPQLFNVLIGNMSLVGPRPPTVREYEMYELEHLRRLEVVPGMTGLWQVSARTDPSFETYLRYDVEYIEKWSIWLDFRILLKTIPTVLSGSGC